MAENFLRHPATRRYSGQARRFCHLATHYDNYAIRDYLLAVEQSLAGLYHAALSLPETQPIADFPSIDPDDVHRHWRKHFDALRAKLGNVNFYAEIFDPYGRDDFEPIWGSLASDISEVNYDVSEGIKILDLPDGNECLEKFWQIRTRFDNHWGHHAVDAIRAIRALTQSYDLRESSFDPMSIVAIQGQSPRAWLALRNAKAKTDQHGSAGPSPFE